MPPSSFPKRLHSSFPGSCWLGPVFKIEVFNALQTRLGPSKYTSLKNNPSKCNSKLEMKTSLEVLNVNLPATRINNRRALSLQEVESDD